MTEAGLLYFEDLRVGDVFELGSHCFEKEEIVSFAARYDPQPFHLDEEAGKASFLGGLCASGWNTCAVVHRLNCDGFLNKIQSLGAPGGDEFRWLKPVYVGDVLTATTTILEARASSSRPKVGLLHLLTQAKNQKGEDIYRLKAWAMVGRKPAG